jgi:hypothetical protein
MTDKNMSGTDALLAPGSSPLKVGIVRGLLASRAVNVCAGKDVRSKLASIPL